MSIHAKDITAHFSATHYNTRPNTLFAKLPVWNRVRLGQKSSRFHAQRMRNMPEREQSNVLTAEFH